MSAVERAQSMSNTQQNSSKEAGLSRNAKIKERAKEAAKPEYVMEFESSMFPTTNREWITTLVDIGYEINKRFRPVMRDYVGCLIKLKTAGMGAPNARLDNGNITVQQTASTVLGCNVPRYEVEFLFQKGYNTGKCLEGAIDSVVESSAFINGKNNKDKDQNGKPKGGGNRVLTMSAINRVNGVSNAGSELTINQATREMLEPFYLDCYKSNIDVEVEVADPDDAGSMIKTKTRVAKPRYDDYLVYTVSDPSLYTNTQTRYVKVINIDLLLLLRAIYGNKNELGHYVDYRVKPIRPIPVPMMGNMAGNIPNALVAVGQLDCSATEQEHKSLGMMSMADGRIPIIR